MLGARSQLQACSELLCLFDVYFTTNINVDLFFRGFLAPLIICSNLGPVSWGSDMTGSIVLSNCYQFRFQSLTFYWKYLIYCQAASIDKDKLTNKHTHLEDKWWCLLCSLHFHNWKNISVIFKIKKTVEWNGWIFYKTCSLKFTTIATVIKITDDIINFGSLFTLT